MDDKLNDVEHAALIAIAEQHGDHAAARLLRLDRASLLRLLLRRKVRRGTTALVRQRLTELRAQPSAASAA